jgi:chromosome segregation ATPase
MWANLSEEERMSDMTPEQIADLICVLHGTGPVCTCARVAEAIRIERSEIERLKAELEKIRLWPQGDYVMQRDQLKLRAEAAEARVKELEARATALQTQLADADDALMKRGIFREEVHTTHEALVAAIRSEREKAYRAGQEAMRERAAKVSDGYGELSEGAVIRSLKPEPWEAK